MHVGISVVSLSVQSWGIGYITNKRKYSLVGVVAFFLMTAHEIFSLKKEKGGKR